MRPALGSLRAGTSFLRSAAGFSLIELMVVVAIIAVLSTVGFAAFTGAQQRSRDAKRRADILALQKGEEQYYLDSGISSYGDPNVVLSSYLVGGVLPKDPSTKQDYFMSVGLRGAGIDPKYCFCAKLEIAGTGNAAAPTAGSPICNGAGTPKDYFCVQNLQ